MRFLLTMLHPDDIARLCQRKYAAFLKSIVTGEPFFPLEICFGRPSTTEEWETLRREINALTEGDLGYRIEWTETNTRRWGRQKFPERVWFENERDFLNALRKCEEVDRFRANIAATREQCPQLEGWLSSNVARIAEFAGVWSDLLNVCRYFLAHPRPGLYSRELSVEVDTKFIERHESILRNLLDFLLPDSAKTEAERFEERFGLRYDEPLVRFRLLDPQLRARLSLPVDDLAIPVSQFKALCWENLIVVIAENKMTFLSLPLSAHAIGIFGGGGAVELLASVDWLLRCQLIYWGDLDVHGFHILSRLRQSFPTITSVMMDEPTLDQFLSHAIRAGASRYEEVASLTPVELKAYERVRGAGLLLEQERISHHYASQQIAETLSMAEQPPNIYGLG